MNLENTTRFFKSFIFSGICFDYYQNFFDNKFCWTTRYERLTSLSLWLEFLVKFVNKQNTEFWMFTKNDWIQISKEQYKLRELISEEKRFINNIQIICSWRLVTPLLVPQTLMMQSLISWNAHLYHYLNLGKSGCKKTLNLKKDGICVMLLEQWMVSTWGIGRIKLTGCQCFHHKWSYHVVYCLCAMLIVN